MKRFYKWMLVLLAALLVMGSLAGCGQKGADDSADGSADSARSSMLEEDGEKVLYPGFTDRTLDWDHRTLTLPNDEKNTVNLIFTVESASDSKELFTSEPVKPGENVQWDVLASSLSSGKQKICIKMTAVLEDGTELNTVSQTISVTLPSAE